MKRFVPCVFPVGSQCKLTAVSLALLAVLGTGSSAVASSAKGATVSEISCQRSGDRLEVRIKGDAELPYTSYELFDPERLVVDVANARLKPGADAAFPGDANVKLQTKEIVDAQPNILRFEFLMGDSYPYSAKQDGDGLVVNFDLNQQELKKVAAPTSGTSSESALAKQLPDTSKAVSASSGSKGHDDFGFSGYERDRISVDFYKMDLHNVFRFLREISGVNIVVDESVKGTLTLTLDDVPWDFALDVILNLKGLQQEERFNTIVIYPKSKEFAWAKRSESQLSFQADDAIAQQDALIISQMEQQSPGMVEAAELIAKGSAFEKQHNPAMAVKAYEEAFAKWRNNGKLANRIAAIYLVDLRQNAKALHYAKEALRIDKKNREAALNAAIASANMRDMNSAATYFDMSTQGSKPSQEALLSYALFREEVRQYDLALQILSKLESLYGKNLEAMVAIARINDKKGASAQAVQAYKAILTSGFALPSDLSRFVRARVGMAN